MVKGKRESSMKGDVKSQKLKISDDHQKRKFLRNKGSSFDVCIIGAGPAGLSAGIYSARYGLKTLILSENLGGMINLAKEIENYPGFIGSGIELMKKFSEQAKKLGCQIIFRKVLDLVKDENKKKFIVKTASQEFSASSLILAVGTEKRKLNISGEESFVGRGVSYCATCDAAFFKDKIVCVIGGNDSAAHTAMLLAGIAKKVYIIYRKHDLRCQAKSYEEIKKCKRIEIITESVLVEIKGKEKVESVVYQKAPNGEPSGEKKELKLDGIFIEAGSMPSNYLANRLGLKRDNEGFIIVNEKMQTNASGVFSAGGINSGAIRQVLTSSASGAEAAISAYNYLKEWK